MRPANDLAGRTFERLKVASRAGSNERGKATWKGVCDCGNAAVIVGYIRRVAPLNVADRPLSCLSDLVCEGLFRARYESIV
jgi:hypothetical protein